MVVACTRAWQACALACRLSCATPIVAPMVGMMSVGTASAVAGQASAAFTRYRRDGEMSCQPATDTTVACCRFHTAAIPCIRAHQHLLAELC